MSEPSQLKQVIANIGAAVSDGLLPVVVFDLDDTLFSTASRDLRIIQEFAADHSSDYPAFAKIANSVSLSDMRWDATDALAEAGLDRNDSSFKPFGAYWTATFFTDSYVALDLPTSGAVNYVNACYNAGALIYYLTGRRVSGRGLTSGMEQGTARALTTRGFPFWKGRCELTLKVDVEQKDDDFKDQALACVRSLHGRVIATFDNEPANANMFLEHFPDALNFWLKTTWDPTDNKVEPDLITIADFTFP